MALWVGGLAAPRTAEAGCAHYVHSRTSPADQIARLEQLAFGLAPAPAPVDQPAPGPAPRGRCPGGLCSANPDLPLSPSPGNSDRLDQWSCLALGVLIRPTHYFAPTFEPALAAPPEFASGLDRPPRAL